MTDEVDDNDTAIAPGDRLAAWVEVLRDIAAEYDGSPDDDDVRRATGGEQLRAVLSYLQEAGVPSEVLGPLLAVAHSLIDLEEGGKPSIFQASRKRGGLGTPHDELRQRGLAAALVTLFLEADKAAGLDGAARKAAFRITKWRCARRRRRNNQSLAEAVNDWREKAQRGGSDEDAASYALMMNHVRDGQGPAYWADWILTAGYKPYR